MSNKTAVMNVDKKAIVWLDLSSDKITNQESVYHGLTVNMPMISDKDYMELADEPWATPLDEKDTYNYFFQRCIDYANEHNEHFLSDVGYSRAYKYLINKGFDIKQILEQIQKIIELFIETEAGGDDENLFISSYKVEGELTDLYLTGSVKNNPLRIVGDRLEY